MTNRVKYKNGGNMSSNIVPLCRETFWKDLSEIHKRIREELERYIESYAKSGRCPGPRCITPIIVAPYGSGKSELLKYLCNWSWSKGIPALHVDLSEIVKYINKKGISAKISEKELPEVLEEFFLEKLNNFLRKNKDIPESIRSAIFAYRNNEIRGVLLIDEIEEAFESLKKLVEYQTSPFRGLFDEVHDRKLKFFPILAFGPSTALMEASSLAAGWRTNTISIPLYSPKTIEDLIGSEINYPYRKLIANMLWWASKGRIGWVYNLLNSGIVDYIANLINRLKNDKTLIKRLKENPFDEKFRETLRKEIVKEVPLFNELAYTEHYDSIPLPGEKDLFKILAILVGPLSETDLLKIFDVEKISGIELRKIVSSSEIVSKSQLLESIMKSAEKIVDDMYQDKTPRELERILEDLRYILDTVLESWCYNDTILLSRVGNSFDVSPLEKLKDVAINIALETYKNEVLRVLDQISMKRVVKDLDNHGKIYDLNEEYYAIHPSVLVDIYPPIMVEPFIACSKELKGNPGSLISIMNNLRSNQYLNIMNTVIEKIKANKIFGEVNIYFVHNVDIIGKFLKDKIIQDIKGSGDKVVVLIPIATSDKELNDLRNNLENELKYFRDLGLVVIADPGLRLSMFLAGLIYSAMKCPFDLERVINSRSIDAYIFQQYIHSLEGLITERNWYDIQRKVNQEIRKYISEGKDFEAFDELVRRRGSAIGSDQAVYAWIISLANNNVKTSLLNILDRLIEIRKLYKSLIQETHNVINNEIDSNIIEKYENTVFKNIKLITGKQGRNYIKSSIKIAKVLNTILNNYPILKSVKEIVEDIVEKELISKGEPCSNLKRRTDRLVKSLDNIFDRIMPDYRLEPLKYILVADTLSKVVNEKCESRVDSISYDIRRAIDQLSVAINSLKETENNIEDLTDTIKDLELGQVRIQLVNRLNKLKGTIKSLANKLDEIRKELENGLKFARPPDAYSSLLYAEFVVREIVQEFAKRISGEGLNSIRELKDMIDEIKAIFEKIENDVDKLDTSDMDYIRKIIGRDLIDELKEDLKYILSTTASLRELKEKLKEYYKKRHIYKIVETVEKLEELREEDIHKELEEILELVKQLSE